MIVWPKTRPGQWPLATEPLDSDLYVEPQAQPHQRPTMEQTLLGVAGLLADRSTCTRGAVGCVIADERGHILSTGYNGAPAGAPHCTEVGCLIEGGHCVRAVHAEVNAVAAAARHGIPLGRAWAYCTVRPCLRCAYALIGAGVWAILYHHPTGSEEGTADEVKEACNRAAVHLRQSTYQDHYGLLRYRQSPKAAE